MTTKKQRAERNKKLAKWGLYAVLAIFVASILWSMWVETLRPLLRSGDTAAFVNNLIGLPITLIATGFIIYGGYRVILASLSTLTSDPVKKNLAVITSEEKDDGLRSAQLQNAMMFFRAWVPGGSIMLLGFGLMALGGWLINR